MKMVLNTDGGARGNPGPGAIGVVLKNSDGDIILELGQYIGRSTNNEAEYKALLTGLKSAKEKNASSLSCYLDSELVVKQMRGEYKVKNSKLKKFFDEAKKLEKSFTKIEYKHVPRSKNKEADTLVNKVLDSTL